MGWGVMGNDNGGIGKKKQESRSSFRWLVRLLAHPGMLARWLTQMEGKTTRQKKAVE